MTGRTTDARLAAARVAALAQTAAARPAVQVTVALQVVGGVVAASVPTALSATPGGAGLGSGLGFGAVGALWVACATLPVVVGSFGRRDADDARALYLAGWPPRLRLPVTAAAGLLVCAAGVGLAALAGALAGAADSWRNGSGGWTAVAAPAIPWEALITTLVMTLALSAWGEASVFASTAVLGGWATFILLLPPTRGTWARTVLEWTPFAPAWSALYRDGSYRLLLPMSSGQATVVTMSWTVVAIGAVAGGVWRSTPPR